MSNNPTPPNGLSGDRLVRGRSPNRRNIKVLHLTRWVGLTGGGIRAYISSVTAALEGSEIDTVVAGVAAANPQEIIWEVEHMGLPAVSIRMNAWRFARYLLRGVKEADVVHIHGIFDWPFFMGAPICLARKVPFVVSPHAMLMPWYLERLRPRYKRFFRILGCRWLRRSAAVVATTTLDADDLFRLDPTLNVHIVSPCVAVASDSTEPRPVGVESTSLKVGYLGWIRPVKGVDRLLQAAALLRGRGLDMEVKLIGPTDKEYEQRLKREISRLDLGEIVTFLGYLSGGDKEKALRECDVMAMPSFAENFNYATAESLMSGVPVVVTEAVGLANVVRKYRCGVVVRPGDVNGLAEALALFSDPEFRQDCRRGALRAGREEFSPAVMGRSLKALYLSAAKHKRGNSRPHRIGSP